jgi:hypothetical protein
MSVVALIIGSGFRLGLRAWEQGEKEILETQRIRALSSLLSQQLKSVYPYKTKIDDKKVIVFEGESNSLIFVTSFVGQDVAGFKWVKYSYEDRSLLYNEGILPDKKLPDSTTGEMEVMDEDLHEVKFEYFSAGEGSWKDSWELGEEIPAAVKVTIEYFPPFFITLPLSQEKVEEGKVQEDEK